MRNSERIDPSMLLANVTDCGHRPPAIPAFPIYKEIQCSLIFIRIIKYPKTGAGNCWRCALTRELRGFRVLGIIKSYDSHEAENVRITVGQLMVTISLLFFL